MTDLSSTPDPNGDDTGASSVRRSTTGTPLWVKLFGIITLIVILLFVILQLIGAVEHGPGQHIPSGGDVGELIWLFVALQAAK